MAEAVRLRAPTPARRDEGRSPETLAEDGEYARAAGGEERLGAALRAMPVQEKPAPWAARQLSGGAFRRKEGEG